MSCDARDRRAYRAPGPTVIRRDAGVEVAPEVGLPVIGYREWVLIGDEILSPLARTPWREAVMRAECLPSCRAARGLWRGATRHPGPAPDPACVCGIYALFEPPRRRGRERLALVHGAVALSGRIEVHRRGMRAELARIVALGLPSARRAPYDALVRVADRLEVDAVPPRELETVALAHGRPLAPALIPDADGAQRSRGGRLLRPRARGRG
jgi:hypothetical protein